jgi:ribosomal RNA-processing protein 12
LTIASTVIGDLHLNMLDQILSTILVFLSSANREIVKSALGFIKLSVHTLPVEMVIPHLKLLVPSLLNWSGDHKNHFKVKVRHIFERMIRRFGWEIVYGCVGHEADEKEKGKVLLNIKKRKDRAKRKKAKNAADGDEDDDGEDVCFLLCLSFYHLPIIFVGSCNAKDRRHFRRCLVW